MGSTGKNASDGEMHSTELSRSVIVSGLPIVYWEFSGKTLTFRSLVKFACKTGKLMFIFLLSL